MANEPEDTVWLHGERRIRLVELSDACGMPQALLRELVEFGALSPVDSAASEFAADCLPTLRAAARLAADFELETHAVALVLSYLKRIERLEGELRALRAKHPG